MQKQSFYSKNLLCRSSRKSLFLNIVAFANTFFICGFVLQKNPVWWKIFPEISEGVGYFERKEISARDVTEEFIDTEARLKNKKILEARYQELLKKATKVSEMLEIEQQLSEVRQEIESNEGRLKYLQSRVSMSTLKVEFYETVAGEKGITISYGTKMKNALAEGFYGISRFFLGLLYIWPLILILVVLIFVLRKRFRRKKTL